MVTLYPVPQLSVLRMQLFVPLQLYTRPTASAAFTVYTTPGTLLVQATVTRPVLQFTTGRKDISGQGAAWKGRRKGFQ